MSKKIIIEITNTKGLLRGDIKTITKIKNHFKVRNPNAYWIRVKSRNMDRNWDGKINYITDANYFKIGLLPSIYKFITEDLKQKVKIEDYRNEFIVDNPTIPKKVGINKPRPYQEEAIRKVITNKVGGVSFPIGVINAATNAGKTTICAGIYLAYKRKIPALVIINDGDLYNQFKKEIPELVGNDYGGVRGKEQNWNNFTIVMAQTIARNIKKYQNKLKNYGIVLIDEYDLADNKTYKSILMNCNNAFVRVGLSGSIYMSKLAKHKPKNMNLRSFSGDEIFKISKTEMVEKGHSTNLIIKLFPGNNKLCLTNDYQVEYNNCIVYNEDRNSLIIDRVIWNISKIKRKPIVVICRLHDHVDMLYKMLKLRLGNQYNIDYVYGGRKDRKIIIENFRDGKIDILVSSLILTRGKNFPLLKVLINAAAGDSQERVSQLMGRLERKHESKNKGIMEDFMDEGSYFRRHSKHRKIYYKQEKFKVIEK